MVAARLAPHGSRYLGKSSPWRYDIDQFRELLFASGNRAVRDLIANLDGCSGGKAGEIVAQADLSRATCQSVADEEAARLLQAARNNAKPVNAKRLGAVGPEPFPSHAYAIAYGETCFGSTHPQAEIPFAVEAWVRKDVNEKTSLVVCVNRTPTTGSAWAARKKRDIVFYGCGLSHIVAQGPSAIEFEIWVNITTPYMPITSDGKAPDLLPFFNEIEKAVSKAARQAHRPESGPRVSQKMSFSTISMTSSPKSAATAATGSTRASFCTSFARSSRTRWGRN